MAPVMALLPQMLAAGDLPDWWVGRWAWDLEWCVNSERIGSVTPAPIALTADEFLGYENSCAILAAREVTEGTVFLQMSCESEGSTYEQPLVVLRGIDGIWLWYGGGEPTFFGACPPGPAHQ